ncbi:hypothetical protein DWG18_04670 [Lysobacter sp. TY2-98]|uniref:hypothetical protein n=1 Tax=Lysobacter sp. TY2-98 TaxID=2290922 RepID=UPI000E208702|nr:hypothetical protein [Lysobacter sp. TY2-98]AXK71651.1 hypothetical protein DWG18_04670 [Lysobacter sp. TY2-98]
MARSVAGETTPHKAAAIFQSVDTARAAAAAVRSTLGMPDQHVRTLDATTPHPGRAAEPESAGIFQTMLRAHAALGVAGFVAGLLLYWVLRRMGIGFIVDAPLAAAGAIVFFCTIGGLLLGGLVTLRPDHDPYVMKILDACREGRAAVVVHGRTADERDAAVEFLRSAGGDVIQTL